MRLGINLMLFTGWPTIRDLDVVQAMKAIGYDTVEVPIIDPADHKWPAFGKMLRDEGLSCTISSVMPPGLSLALDNQTAAKATDFHWRLIDAAKTLGASMISGPLYHPLGEFPDGVTQAALIEKLASRIAYLGLPYQGAGLRLALEPMNRYETSVLNTCASAHSAISKANGDWLGICTDTYHMHTEEKSYESLDILASRWSHAHVSESDRGQLGTGQVWWDAWAAAVRRNKFAGDVVVCAYSQSFLHAARSTRLWRDVASDPLDVARASFRFITDLIQS